MALVHMSHPEHGDLKVPDKSVKHYERAGWAAKSKPKQPAATAAGKQSKES